MTTVINSATLIAERTLTIDWYKNQLTCLRKNQKALTKTAKHVNTIFARHPEIVALSWTTVAHWVNENQVTLNIGVTHEVTSMKEGIAPAFMRSLLEAGFDVEATTDTADSQTSQRKFDFKRPGNDQMVAVSLVFNAKLLNAPDATCRKVQTGMKTVEVATYALVCEE